MRVAGRALEARDSSRAIAYTRGGQGERVERLYREVRAVSTTI